MKCFKDEPYIVSQEYVDDMVKIKQHCCQCGKMMTEAKGWYVCFHAACPNYSLLQAGEDFMIKLSEDKTKKDKINE